jgi:hypothetical protein
MMIDDDDDDDDDRTSTLTQNTARADPILLSISALPLSDSFDFDLFNFHAPQLVCTPLFIFFRGAEVIVIG